MYASLELRFVFQIQDQDMQIEEYLGVTGERKPEPIKPTRRGGGAYIESCPLLGREFQGRTILVSLN